MSVNSRLHNLGTSQVDLKKPYFYTPDNYSVVGLSGTKGIFLVDYSLSAMRGFGKFKTFDGAFASFLLKCGFCRHSSHHCLVRLVDLSTNQLIFSFDNFDF